MTKNRTPKAVPARSEPTPDALHRDMRKMAREAKYSPNLSAGFRARNHLQICVRILNASRATSARIGQRKATVAEAAQTWNNRNASTDEVEAAPAGGVFVPGCGAAWAKLG